MRYNDCCSDYAKFCTGEKRLVGPFFLTDTQQTFVTVCYKPFVGLFLFFFSFSFQLDPRRVRTDVMKNTMLRTCATATPGALSTRTAAVTSQSCVRHWDTPCVTWSLLTWCHACLWFFFFFLFFFGLSSVTSGGVHMVQSKQFSVHVSILLFMIHVFGSICNNGTSNSHFNCHKMYFNNFTTMYFKNLPLANSYTL